MSVGIQETATNISHEHATPRQSCSSNSTCTAPDDEDSEAHAPKKKKQKISPLEKYETNVTKQLSNNELQRLVLLKQLRVLDMKEEKLKRQLNPDVNEQSTSSNNSNIIMTCGEDGRSYFNLLNSNNF